MFTNRGKEGKRHKQSRKRAVNFLTRNGCDIFTEYKGCDTVGLRLFRKKMEVFCVESEMRKDHCVKNAVRNFQRGCTFQITITPSLKVKEKVLKKIREGLPEELIEKIIVVTEKEIEDLKI